MSIKQHISLIIFILVISNFSFAQNWEVNLLNDINPAQPTSAFQQNISKSVYPLAVATPVSMFAVGLFTKDKKLQQQSYKVVGSLLINTAITQAMKYSINRQRPYDAYPTIINPYTIEKDASFPSGHTSTAFALATSMSIQYKKWYVVVPAYAWAGGVGYSRMYLGEHYPTDVLAGAAIGIGSAYLSEWLNKKLFKKSK
ncbi:MAG: phosphatase PAP2 family protein [Bacteroidetes bacterium]|nr:phosphatase PAP2 family protein [Bacteroidota bacterium]